MNLRFALRLSLPAALAACLLGCPPEATTAPPAASPEASAPAETTPATTPVAAPSRAPFDRETAETPWADAKVGDWCEYKMFQPKEMTMRVEVVEVGDDTLVWKRAIDGSDRGTETVDLAEEEERYQDPRSLDAIDGEPEEKTIEIGGKELKVLIVKRKAPNGAQTESWVTRDLPPIMTQAGGWASVKAFRDGELMQELIDFGSAE